MGKIDQYEGSATVKTYFREHPEKEDDVMKATYAFQISHFREIETAHNFTSTLRSSECIWCQRSREEVRYDHLPPQCQKRPTNIPSIEVAIRNEELKFFSLQEKSKTIIETYIRKNGLTGEGLSVLHHTYGYEPEVVGSFFEITPTLYLEYERYMDEECSRSKTAHKKEIVTVIE